MLFWENVRLALTSLAANKSRAFLTMLGIIIGIASVIAIMTVGNSLNASVSESMVSMGANNITVYITEKTVETDEREDGTVFGTVKRNVNITEDDYITDDMIFDLLDEYPDEVKAVSVTETVGSSDIKAAGETLTLDVSGVSRGYFIANNIELTAGRYISLDESTGAKAVIMVSSGFVDDAYDGDYKEALGKELTLSLNSVDYTFTIVGVYDDSDSTSGMGAFMTSNSTSAYIPQTLAKDIMHTKNYTQVAFVASEGVDCDRLATKIKNFMNGFYRTSDTIEVNAFSMASMVSVFSSMMSTLTLAISIIAGIALLVGGIGVMNIMLVSITERTREIGTRKALGATNTSIRIQFITESMIICLIGGIIGVALGVGGGMLAAKLLGYAATPSLKSIVGSLAFSLAIGLFFGYHPANKAAKMNPIEALRYE